MLLYLYSRNVPYTDINKTSISHKYGQLKTAVKHGYQCSFSFCTHTVWLFMSCSCTSFCIHVQK